MKPIVKLIQSSAGRRVIGNHTANKINSWLSKYYYYSTCICTANSLTKKFAVDASYGTFSTIKACNSYRAEFKALGYEELSDMSEVENGKNK